MKTIFYLPPQNSSKDIDNYYLQFLLSIISVNFLFTHGQDSQIEIHSNFDTLSIFSEIFPYNLELTFQSDLNKFTKSLDDKCLVISKPLSVDIKKVKSLNFPYSMYLKDFENHYELSDMILKEFKSKKDTLNELSYYLDDEMLKKFIDKINTKFR